MVAVVLESQQKMVVIADLRVKISRMALLLFANLTYWMINAWIFQQIEGNYEDSYKCGVKRVHRDFVDSLWNKTKFLSELEWKSLARRHLMQFEEELLELSSSGIDSYSGHKLWTYPNAFLFSFSTTSTIGSGSLVPVSFFGKMFFVVFVMVGTPLFAFFINETSWVLEKLTICTLQKIDVSKYFKLQQQPNFLLAKLRREVGQYLVFQATISFGNIPIESPLLPCLLFTWIGITLFHLFSLSMQTKIEKYLDKLTISLKYGRRKID